MEQHKDVQQFSSFIYWLFINKININIERVFFNLLYSFFTILIIIKYIHYINNYLLKNNV